MKLVKVGYFSRTHGIKGELVLREEGVLLSDAVNAIFIEGASGMAPYFVSTMKEGRNGIILGLEDLDSDVDAKKLVGKKVHADEQFVEAEESAAGYVGFSVYNGDALVGEIVALNEEGAQLLATVNYNGKEVLLPLADELIDEIDEAGKRVVMRVPDGLLDMV